MKAYKLLKLRKNGTLGSLFINAKAILPLGIWLDAKPYPTKGFALRPGWHCCSKTEAPHLSKKGRVWAEVEIEDYNEHIRPASQGGLWYTANKIKIERILNAS